MFFSNFFVFNIFSPRSSIIEIALFKNSLFIVYFTIVITTIIFIYFDLTTFLAALFRIYFYFLVSGVDIGALIVYTILRFFFRIVDFRVVDFKIANFKIVDFKIANFRVTNFKIVNFRIAKVVANFKIVKTLIGAIIYENTIVAIILAIYTIIVVDIDILARVDISLVVTDFLFLNNTIDIDFSTIIGVDTLEVDISLNTID